MSDTITGVETSQETSQGTAQASGGRAAFSVHDPAAVWLVRTGAIDLFIMGARDNRPSGPRAHLLRIAQGEAMFGMALTAPDVMLVAAPTAGARLAFLSRPDLRRMTEFGRARDAQRLLDIWIQRLAAALSGELALGAIAAIVPGETLTVGDEPKCLIPRHDVVWVNHRAGQSSLLGGERVSSIADGSYFPVSRQAWVTTAAGSVIEVVDACAALRADPEGRGLTDFHTAVTLELRTRYQEMIEKERGRVQARSAFDARLLDASMRSLGAPFRRHVVDREGFAASQAPVFLAFEAIARRLRIAIRPPSNSRAPLTVESIAEASGVRVRRVALSGAWWRRQPANLIGFRAEDNYPYALMPRGNGRVECLDPLTGQSRPVNRSIARELSPFGYVVYHPFPGRALSVVDLLKHSLPDCRWELVAIAAAGIGVGMLGVVSPIATGIAYDHFIPAANKPGIVQLSIFLLLVSLASALVNLVGAFAALRLRGLANASLQAAQWDRLLNLPVSFFRRFSSGELAQRGLGISAIHDLLTNTALNAILSGVFSLFSFFLLFYYSWRMALVGAVLVGTAVGVTLACTLVQLRRQRELVKVQARITSLLVQLIGGVAKLRVSGTEKRAFAAWAREFARQTRLAMEIRSVSRALTVFMSAMPLVSTLTLFYCFSIQFTPGTEGAMTTGVFLAFTAAFGQFLSRSLSLGSAVVETLGIVPLYEMTEPILKATPEASGRKVTPGRLTGAIELSHVSFRYREDHPLVLRDVTITIEPGQFVAIVGASGSGKSTLLRLLLGFEEPVSGAIYYDRQDLARLEVQSVRKQLGVVLQSARPVNDSILKNIIGSAPLTVNDAWEAARMAGLDEDIKQMAMGMHTRVSDFGSNISGGQRQRLMIARALVGRPRILLFDEATSALDNHTQTIVSRGLETLQATRVVIAHRLSTIVNADQIYVIDKGSVVQSGTFRQLMEADGPFQELVRRQMT